MIKTSTQVQLTRKDTTAVIPNKLVTLGPTRFELGYWQGMRQTAVLVPLHLMRLEVNASSVKRFDEIVELVCPPQANIVGVVEQAVSEHPVLGRLLRATVSVLEKMSMPVMGGATAIRPEMKNKLQWIVGLPAVAESNPAPQAALRLVCALMNELVAGKTVRPEALGIEVHKLIEQFRPLAPTFPNTLQFLQAAHEKGIPWRHVVNNVYQFGWGARSRWMDSSLTQDASGMSGRLARNKELTASVLRRAGLPVPSHTLVGSAQAAVNAADVFGYPVVVKAANLDGGYGVYVGLKSADDVRIAFEEVSKLTGRVLVEKYIKDEDYRLQVYKNEVYWVIHRKPAGVFGDGTSSIHTLIDNVNLKRQSALNAKTDILQPILIDDEVERWLRDQGYGKESIPVDGVFVRLRGVANVSKGGTLLPALEIAHPDNLALAVRAVRILRLDIAGVDLLIPDISKSWIETGATICEVNAQPQVSPHIPAWLMSRWFPDRGRIPVFATVDDPVGADWYLKLLEHLKVRNINLGVARKSSFEITCDTSMTPAEDICTAVQCLLGDPVVDMLMIVVEDPRDLHDRLPVDCLDALILQEHASNLSVSQQSDVIVKRLADISTWIIKVQGGRAQKKETVLEDKPMNSEQLIERLLGLLER